MDHIVDVQKTLVQSFFVEQVTANMFNRQISQKTGVFTDQTSNIGTPQCKKPLYEMASDKSRGTRYEDTFTL